MKHLPPILFRVLSAVLLLIAAQACIDEDKFAINDKLVTDIELNPGVAAPVAHGSYTIADFLEEKKDTLIYDETADSLIKFVFSEDSVYNFRFEDFYETPDIPSVEKTENMGNIQFPTDESVKTTIELQTFADSTGNPAIQTLIDNPNPTIVPEFELSDIGSFDFEAAANFVSITAESGKMVISMTNYTNFPVYARFSVANSDMSPVFSNLRIPEGAGTTVDAGDTEVVEKDLAGQKMTQTITAELEKFGTYGTSSPVMVNADDSLRIEAETENLVVASGEVYADSVDHSFATDTIIDFSSDQTEAELAELTMKSGDININMDSQIGMDMEITLKLPNTFEDSNMEDTLKRTYSVPARSPLNETIDLSGTITNLSYNGEYNKLPVEVKAETVSNGGTVTFTKDDYLTVTTSIDNFEIDHIKGNFPSDTLEIEQDEFELGLDIFDQIDGGFKLTDPEFIFRLTNNGVGIPAHLNLNMEAQNGPNTEALGYDFGDLDIPGNVDETITDEYRINKNTSNIVDFMALPPKKITYSGSAIINPQTGSPSYDNFITGDAKVNLSFETEIPLAIETDSLSITDTLELDLAENIEEFEQGNLLLDYTNGMPLALYVKLIPYNAENDTEYGTIQPENSLLLEAAATENAIVTNATSGTTTIPVEGATFDDLTNADHLILQVRVATYNGQPAELHANAELSLKVRLNASGNLTVE